MVALTPASGELFVPMPNPLRPVALVRSTLLISSLNAVRQAGHLDRYKELIDPVYRERVLGAVAFAWLPVGAAIAHYAACDGLELATDEQVALGRATGKSIKDHLTLAISRFARGVGVSPWTVFEQFPRFWARAFDGGGVAIRKFGPKDAVVSYAACDLLVSRYFRTALRGVAMGLVETVCARAYMSEIRSATTDREASYRVQWA